MTVNKAIETLRYEIDEEGHCGYIADEIHLLIEALEQKDLEIKILIRKKEALKDEIADLTTEVERLKNAYKQCAWERDAFLEELKTAKSEAIKDFAERLKEYFPSIADAIDFTAEELIGG
jgi:cell division septum initiation protein DivIVA